MLADAREARTLPPRPDRQLLGEQGPHQERDAGLAGERAFDPRTALRPVISSASVVRVARHSRNAPSRRQNSSTATSRARSASIPGVGEAQLQDLEPRLERRRRPRRASVHSRWRPRAPSSRWGTRRRSRSPRGCWAAPAKNARWRRRRRRRRGRTARPARDTSRRRPATRRRRAPPYRPGRSGTAIRRARWLAVRIAFSPVPA